MLSPYRIPPNITKKRRKKTSNTNLDDDSQREHDVKRSQMTTKYLKRPQMNSNGPVDKPVKVKTK